MLLKLPIILFFPAILFILTHYSQNYSQYKASYYITNLYCYVKNYNISYLNKKSKKDLWFSQLAKGISAWIIYTNVSIYYLCFQ